MTKGKIIIFLSLLVFGLVSASGVQLHLLKSLKAELALEKRQVQALEEKASAASAARLAISEQAQACLDRESQRSADAGIWLEILEQSQSRDISDREKNNVPDDKIRDALLDALDRPL